MGGRTTGRSEGLEKPKVYADFHMCDMQENLFGSPFTANIRPTARYGHNVASNVDFNPDLVKLDSDYPSELIIIGGMDS